MLAYFLLDLANLQKNVNYFPGFLSFNFMGINLRLLDTNKQTDRKTTDRHAKYNI